jgi:hypothetical protein
VKWVARIISALAVLVVLWACLTAWPAIVHGYPLYAVLLAGTALVGIVVLVRSFRTRKQRGGWRLVLGIVTAAFSVLWLAAMVWLRPFSAVQPALAAMDSDAAVVVSESPTQIVMFPTGDKSDTAVFFQPGAKVEARAYAAVLRPLAEAGHLVVIPKQPLGIAFLATGAFEKARAAHPDATNWVVGGHSLGGTVAAIEAEAHDTDPQGPVSGLLLYASYPGSDMSKSLSSAVLSISGSNDGLATPSDIEASRANLPADAQFIAIAGAVHSYFGDYGPQPGDGQPTISHDAARQQISGDSVKFADSVQSGATR